MTDVMSRPDQAAMRARLQAQLPELPPPPPPPVEKENDPLRPRSFEDYVGQIPMKIRLLTHIQAALQQDRRMDHVFLHGPAGMGKTTLAHLIADELGLPFMEVTMPISESRLIKILETFEGVLLLDEIHNASKAQQEGLMPLVWSGEYYSKAGRTYECPALTIIGATTERHKMNVPLWERFMIKPDFDEYSDEEMAEIVLGMADRAGVSMDEDTAVTLGRATVGVPRKAKQFVYAARDLHETEEERATADAILSFCRIDSEGLTRDHLAYLQYLQKLGGRAGMRNLASLLGLNEAVVVDLERMLFKRELVVPTPRGRELTSRGYQKLKGLR